MINFMDTISPILGYLVPSFILGMSLEGDPGGGDPPADPPAPVAYAPAEDIASDPVFEKYKTQDERDRALIGAQKFLGREKIPVPSGVDDKEAYNLLYKTMGHPDTPEGYIVPTDLEIPKDLPLDENMLNDFKKLAHEEGYSPKQFDAAYRWYMNTLGGQFTQMNENNATAGKEAETSLRSKWGAAYEQNVALANKVFDGFLSDETLAEFRTKDWGDNPVLVELFSNIGKVLSEDQLTGKPPTLTLSPTEAKLEIEKIKGNLKHSYWDGAHPGHTAALAEMDRLTKLTMAGQ